MPPFLLQNEKAPVNSGGFFDLSQGWQIGHNSYAKRMLLFLSDLSAFLA